MLRKTLSTGLVEHILLFFVEYGAQEGALKCSTSPVDSFFALIKKVIRKTLSTRLVEDLGRQGPLNLGAL